MNPQQISNQVSSQVSNQVLTETELKSNKPILTEDEIIEIIRKTVTNADLERMMICDSITANILQNKESTGNLTCTFCRKIIPHSSRPNIANYESKIITNHIVEKHYDEIMSDPRNKIADNIHEDIVDYTDSNNNKCLVCDVVFNDAESIISHCAYFHCVTDDEQLGNIIFHKIDQLTDQLNQQVDRILAEDDNENGNNDNDDNDDNDDNEYAIISMARNNAIRIITSGTDEEEDNNEDNNEDEDEEEEEDNDETYTCPICRRIYSTQARLMVHFYNNHDNYEQLSNLDDTGPKGGFPGFDILKKINAIRYIQPEEKLHSNKCVICDYHYGNHFKSIDDSYINTNTEQKYKSNYKSKYYDDLCINTKSEFPIRHPLEMKCCKANLCADCLKNHIEFKNGDPECPFCRHNHSQLKQKYIVIDSLPCYISKKR